MSKQEILPTPEAVRELMGEMILKDVITRKSHLRTRMGEGLVAIYTTGQGRLVGACRCDFPLAASMGAALTLMPAGVAKEAVEAQDLPGELRGNFGEVMNIVAQLFRPEFLKARVVLEGIYTEDQVPRMTQRRLKRPKKALNVDVEIAGYPAGMMQFLAA